MMIKNAFAYVTRKSLKSLIIMLVILAMSTLSLISLSSTSCIFDYFFIQYIKKKSKRIINRQ